MDVLETDLPGVGKKHEIDLRSGVRAVVLTHNTGDRELLCKDDSEGDPERLLKLTDQEARVLGTVLEGAYFQPIESGDEGSMIGDKVMLDWVSIGESTPVLGEAVASVVPKEISVLAVLRSGDLITDSAAETILDPGDRLIVAGGREAVTDFEDELTGPA